MRVHALCEGPAFQFLDGLLLRVRLSGRRGAVAFSVAAVSHHNVLRWRLELGLVCARRRRTGFLPRYVGLVARSAVFARQLGRFSPGSFARQLPLIPVDRARVEGRLPGTRAIEAYREPRIVAPRGS